MSNFFDRYRLPIDAWVQAGADVVIAHIRPITQAVRWPVESTLGGMQSLLTGMPAWLVLLLFFLIGWRASSFRVGLFAAGSLLLIGLMGLWTDAVITLAMVLCAGLFTLAVGLVLGILGVQYPRFWACLRPVLDVMQSTPSLVYLVPVVMLFGIGTVPGVLATMIFATPPMVRLTYLGLSQTPEELLEAADAYGSTSVQKLWHVRLPLALPAIATGLNQVVMFSLVMSAIVAMIGAEGLGASVLRAVGRLDLGLALTSGLAIVLMAVSLDRMTQRLGKPADRKVLHAKRSWWRRNGVPAAKPTTAGPAPVIQESRAASLPMGQPYP